MAKRSTLLTATVVDKIEAYLLMPIAIRAKMAVISPTQNERAATVPMAVPAPTPPLNFKKIEKLCPNTAAGIARATTIGAKAKLMR